MARLTPMFLCGHGNTLTDSVSLTLVVSEHPPARGEEKPYSAWPSMIGPNNCHFSPVNFIIWTCSIG
jgi:hypothetical protein